MCLPRLIIALSLVLTGSAIADTSSTTTLSDADFKLSFLIKENNQYVQMIDTEANEYFNSARCLCGPTSHIKIRVEPASTDALIKLDTILTTRARKGTGRLYIADVGPNCLSNNLTDRTGCINLLSAFDDSGSFFLSDLNRERFWDSPEIPVETLFGDASKCTELSTTRIIYLWLGANADTVSDSQSGPKKEIVLDGVPPATPTMTQARGGNQSLTVEWKWETDPTNSTLQGFVVFCAKNVDSTPGLSKQDSTSIPYVTPALLCEQSNFTDPLLALDPNYRCSGSSLISPTKNDFTIRPLVNGTEYRVAVVAIDKSGNISPVMSTIMGTPVPTVDFFTEYTSAGGKAQGCAMGTFGKSGGASLLILALIAFGWGLYRRRIARGGRLFLGLLLLLGSASAHAQAVYRTDAFNSTPDNQVWNGSPRRYALELRFGPYLPDVDSEFTGSQTAPYAFTFGSKSRLMSQLEFDFEILQSFGTLAVGIQAGQFRSTAKACESGTKNASGTTCTRTSDNTSLSLIPFALLAVYRFDIPAMVYNVPLVPYVKAGFNYTVWTIRNSTGDVVELDNGNRSQGGTAGWQMAAGLSLMLDFLDPGAARAFDGDIGVNHTYAFFEVSKINGRGLGAKNVLHVGDTTWFGGLMFEF